MEWTYPIIKTWLHIVAGACLLWVLAMALNFIAGCVRDYRDAKNRAKKAAKDSSEKVWRYR